MYVSTYARMNQELVHFGKVTPLLAGRIPKMQIPVFLDDAEFPAKKPTTNYKVDHPLCQRPVNIALRNTKLIKNKTGHNHPCREALRHI